MDLASTRETSSAASDPILVLLGEEPIDVPALLARVSDRSAGAVNLFLGVVRDEHEGRRVERLCYEAYAPMALRVLREIAGECIERHGATRAAIAHRLGWLEIGEASVAVCVSAPHRAQGFDACRHAIERLKADAPIWKKEVFRGGETWVANASANAGQETRSRPESP